MNRFEFLGRLSKEVESKSIATASGKAMEVATFSIAVNRRIVGADGERQADFFNLTAFGKTAEFCAKYFKKGQQVLVTGRIQNRSWDDSQTGQRKYTTDYIIENCYFADSNRTKDETAQPATEDFITIDETEELPF